MRHDTFTKAGVTAKVDLCFNDHVRMFLSASKTCKSSEESTGGVVSLLLSHALKCNVIDCCALRYLIHFKVLRRFSSSGARSTLVSFVHPLFVFFLDANQIARRVFSTMFALETIFFVADDCEQNIVGERYCLLVEVVLVDGDCDS